MIEVIFELGSEVILIVIEGNDVKFGSTTYGAQLADISGLKLSYEGVVREFPDLETADDWKEIATGRFKEKLNSLKGEEAKCTYLIKELESCGYKAKSKRRNGFRTVKIG